MGASKSSSWPWAGMPPIQEGGLGHHQTPAEDLKDNSCSETYDTFNLMLLGKC